MRVLFIAEKDSGCDYHRIIMPASFMNGAEKKLITNDLTEERVAEGWDIIVMNRASYDVTLDLLLEWRSKYGFKLVIDTDDWWELDYHHVLYDDYKEGIATLLVEYLKAADLVTVTHERLADKVRPLNENVQIFPNALPYGELQFTDEKEENELPQVRVGWCGSITHDRDMEMLRGPMKRFIGDKRMSVVIGGYNSDNAFTKSIWDRILSAFTASLKIPGQVIPARTPWDYMEMYKHMDIVAIPLLDTPFNAMKSNLKILEAAAKRIPVVVPAIHPYLDFPEDIVCYVHRQTDWHKHLNRLISDRSEREGRGQMLYDYCRKHYDIRNIERNECYQRAISGREVLPLDMSA